MFDPIVFCKDISCPQKTQNKSRLITEISITVNLWNEKKEFAWVDRSSGHEQSPKA